VTADIEAVRAVLTGSVEDVDLPEGLVPAADAAGGGDDGPPDGPPDGLSNGMDGSPEGPSDGVPGGADPRECAGFPLNDIGNGQRFRAYFGQDVMSVPRVGWYVWDGRVWAKDDDEIAVRGKGQQVSGLMEREVLHLVLSDRQMALLAREDAVKAEYDRAAAVTGEDGHPPEDAKAAMARLGVELDLIAKLKRTLGDQRKAHRSYARTTGNSARIDALLKEASIALSRPFDDLDAGPLDVNTESGVLRFTVISGEGFSRMAKVDLLPHARDHLMTKIIPVAWDPEAEAPLFEAFLRRIQPNARIRDFLKRWYGYSMSALTGEQALVFQYGAGANGKSVLVEVMARIFADYAATAKVESLIGRNRRSGGDATPDLVPLMGARFVRASEPEEGERLQEGKIKELTGGEPILVRGLNQDFLEMRPVFKLTMSGNHKPDIRGTDDGIWRRVKLVPFDVQIPKEERDPDLADKLFDECAGILNWLADGLCDYLEAGLQEPEEVTAATQDYRRDSDPVGAFLTECTVVTGEAEDVIRSRDLVEAVQFYMIEADGAAWGPKTLSNKLKDKAGRWRHPVGGQAFSHSRSNGAVYRGIRLTDVFRVRFDKRQNKGQVTPGDGEIGGRDRGDDDEFGDGF
jgi:putative DNA primase/helicase